MSDNDLLRRGDVKAKKVYCDERHEYVVPVAEIDWLIPAVPQEMTAREYIAIEQRCKSWCVSNCTSNGGCESCCYRGSCWADTFDPDAYLRFYILWAKDHPEEANNE